jgi:hypothetical protein
MLSCKDITEKANHYLDKDLSFFARLKVKMHLRMCIHCQRYVDQLNTTILVLGQMKKTDTTNDSTVDAIVESLKEHNNKAND